MNQRSHTGWLTDMAERIAQLERDLAAAQSYATTLAVSMHRQHYAEAAPNWQPLSDLVGLLTQIDNMYAGLRNDFAAAQAERDEARAERDKWKAMAEWQYGVRVYPHDMSLRKGALDAYIKTWSPDAALEAHKER